MTVRGTRSPIRVANFSGYSSDRYEAMDEVMAGDPVDVLVGDYLAEFTLAGMAGQVASGNGSGYVDRFRSQLRPHLPEIARRGVKVVTNAGGLAPSALAAALRADIAAAGAHLTVAHVEGDDVLARIPELTTAGHEFAHLDTGQSMADWGREPISANAYLGAWGIVAALDAGVDIVICGRVTDASLTVGPAAWWHEWATDDWSRLAGAVVAGHIIECGPQATGGNFSGFAKVTGLEHPGFPIAEIAADGSSVITKHARDSGLVTVDTVTAQIVYEIQGPRYLNPDVTVHLESITLSQVGPDRVLVSNVEGSVAPSTTKVAVFAPAGYHLVQTVYLTAPQIEAKTDLLRQQVRHLADPEVHLDITPLGRAQDDPDSQWAATVPVRIMATSQTYEPLAPERYGRRLAGMYLGSFPGIYSDSSAPNSTSPRPTIEYWPALLPSAVLHHRVGLPDGTVVSVPQPPTAPPEQQVVDAETGPALSYDDLVRCELGAVAHTRCGDKGGNSNIGVWVSDDATWTWLRSALTTELLRTLVPEAAELEISRHEFPRLRAVHFVLHGLLGRGASTNLRVDPLGKGVGEYLRARKLLIPRELLR